jgi:hypothetical protein
MNDMNYDVYNKTGRYETFQDQELTKVDEALVDVIDFGIELYQDAKQALTNLLDGKPNATAARYSNPQTYHYSQDFGMMKW